MDANVVKAAAESPLGILALLILVVASIATAYFRNAEIKVKVGVFAAMFGAALAFGIAVLEKSDILRGPPIASAAGAPATGVWDIVINCQQSDVRELGAHFFAGRYFRDFQTGTTNLSMYEKPAGTVHLIGNVWFLNGDLYQVNGTATGQIGSYAGSASFGSRSGCPFTAQRRSD